MAEPPIILTTPKDELLFSKTTKKSLDTNITAPIKVVNNSYLPPQFLFPEYQELDKHLTNHYGLPFTYKRIDPSEYFYIPYGYNYTYLAQPKDFCSDDTFMVVMIMSTVKKPEE